jgi:hypothetical protein
MDKPDIVKHLPRIVSILNGTQEMKELVRGIFGAIVTTPPQSTGRRIGSVRRGAESGGNDNGVSVNRSGYLGPTFIPQRLTNHEGIRRATHDTNLNISNSPAPAPSHNSLCDRPNSGTGRRKPTGAPDPDCCASCGCGCALQKSDSDASNTRTCEPVSTRKSSACLEALGAPTSPPVLPRGPNITRHQPAAWGTAHAGMRAKTSSIGTVSRRTETPGGHRRGGLGVGACGRRAPTCGSGVPDGSSIMVPLFGLSQVLPRSGYLILLVSDLLMYRRMSRCLSRC